jgi:hypothetical protein
LDLRREGQVGKRVRKKRADRKPGGEDVLRLVLVDKLEELSGSVLVKGVRELSDGRGDLRMGRATSDDSQPNHDRKGSTQAKKATNLQPLVEDDLLPLQSNVLGPLDESGEVGLGGEVTS